MKEIHKKQLPIKIGEENNIEIVPVVFITVEALRLNKPMTNKILNRIDAMCKANDIKYQEIQLDCDWTNETKSLFSLQGSKTKIA